MFNFKSENQNKNVNQPRILAKLVGQEISVAELEKIAGGGVNPISGMIGGPGGDMGHDLDK